MDGFKIFLIGVLSFSLVFLGLNSAYAERSGPFDDFPEFLDFDKANLASLGEFDNFPEIFNFDKVEIYSRGEIEDLPEIFDFDIAIVSSHSNTSGSISFKGVVRDNYNSPIPDINVRLVETYINPQDITNSLGQYSLQINPGNYGIVMQPTSFKSLPNLPDRFIVYSSESISVTADTIMDLTIPNVSLDVTVLDFEGNPVSGSSITAAGIESDSNHVTPNIGFNYYFRDGNQTDNSGNANLRVFPSSEVNFVIMPPKDSNLTPFSVSMPVNEDSHITLQFPTPVKFEGTISDGDGSQVSDLLVILYESLNYGYDFTNSLGHFSVDIIPGSYFLYLWSEKEFDYPNLPDQFIMISSDKIDISMDTVQDLTLPNVSLDVTVLDFEGNPVSGSSVTAIAIEYESNEVTPDIEFDYVFVDGAQTDYSGKTKLDLLQSSDIRFIITPPKGSDLKSLIETGLSLSENGARTFVLESNTIENSSTANIRIPSGTSVPGCETTSECFTPFNLYVYQGSTVVWSNDDSAAHTVTAGSAADGPSGEFDSSLFMAGTTFAHTFYDSGTFEYFCMVHPWMDGIVTVGDKPLTNSSGGNGWNTRPTFGESHELEGSQIVENGFSFNGEHFTLTDNHHTDFEKELITVGTVNTFSAKVYADKKLKVQEFLFGIPDVGNSHLAELGVEVWFDIKGNVDDIKVIQKSDVVDSNSLVVTHSKTKCLQSDIEPKCDSTTVSMIFLEPLKNQVMAIKAIDFKNRDQRTYLNDGFEISGESLNPMPTKMIPSSVKNEGLLKITQVGKYNPYWKTEDGRMFEMNSFGSFKQINHEFERFQDSGEARTRLHSGFGGKLVAEQNKALDVFDSTKIISELPDSFGYHTEIQERMNDELKQEMLEQEKLAKKILEESTIQARW